MISFGPWAPDSADFNGQVINEARNVLPGNNCYTPAQALSELSGSVGGEVRGGCMVRDNVGALVLYAGTATDLYRYTAGIWVSVTRAAGGPYALGTEDWWEFCQFGDNLIATNIADVMQRAAITAGTAFANLAGSPPQARHITNVGAYLVASGISGSLNRVHWSATEDVTGWTPGTGNSDIQDFPDGGDVGRVSGRESGLILQRDGVRRMIYQPSSSLIFTFSRVENARGSFPPYSTINVGSVTFYYGLDGFYAAQEGQSTPIGQGFVNDWFINDIDPTKLFSMIGVPDPRSTRVLWAYKSTSGGTGARLDTIIGFDWARNRWFYTRQPFEYVMAAATLGYTLESLDALGNLDALTSSLDSAQYQGGSPSLAGFTTAHKLAFFTGAPLEALIETAETHLAPPGRAKVTGATAYIDATDIRVRAGSRENMQTPVVYGAEGPLEVTGETSLLKTGRYFRFQCRIPAGTTWTQADGIDAKFAPAGRR